MMYNINRRKFLGYFGCGCCSLILPSCTTVPITERKQLSLIPEAKINRQASAAYEQFKTKNNFNKEPVFNPLESCSRIGMPTAKKGIQESKTAE